MPALSQQEMATIREHTLTNRPTEDIDDALHSQLLANLEQNKLANVANGLLTPTKSQPANNETAVNGTHSTASTTSESSGQSGEEENDQGAQSGPESDQDEDTTMQEPDTNNLSEVQEASSSSDQVEDDDDITEEGEKDVAAGLGDADADEEEYEDANSTIDPAEPDNAMAELSDAESEAVADRSEDSDHGDDSDEDIDLCLFCEQKESSETSAEMDLVCTVCRRPAHPSCARSKDVDISDPKSWRCPTCSEKSSASPKEVVNKPRHSAPRLVRDLLPVSRGVQKPGAHSIFAQPLIQDDEGGRALRKRKSDADERVPRTDKPRKKMKETPELQTAEQDPVSHSTRRSSQKLTTGFLPVPTARILQHRPFHKPPPHKFILAFRLDQIKIAAILAEPPRPSRRRYLKKKQKIPAPAPFQPPVPKFPALPTGHLIFPSMFGDREHDINAKPYGGILPETEADTSRSLPQMRDREIFEIARKEAEEERKKTSAKAEAEINGLAGDGANPTNSKRTVSGPPSKIKCIQFGKHVIDTSYAAPYPEEYSHESRLFICEFCLKYLPSEFVAWRHKLKCPAKHPPGDEIYRDGTLSIWEVDGRKKTEYCQCLCLMAKLFLGSKTLYYDVDPFLFYILTEYDEFGYHFVGYFSKEKRPASQNNVSCILVLPIHQRKGYATFLIEFSYLLTRLEGKEGSPEKPLSDMGLTAYRSYWDLTISRHLLDLDDKPFSVKDIMLKTGMTADDVVHSLERLYAFIRDPVTKSYAIRYDKKLYENIVYKYESKEFRNIRPERLVWTPYIMGRSDAATLDAQPVTAVAQREEDLADVEAEDESDRISPKTQDPVQESPSKNAIDPALVNSNGNIAPGPPSTDVVGNTYLASSESKAEVHLTNGIDSKGKGPAEEPLSGYALVFQTEKIPPSRFQIDPPIPAAMLRYAKSRRKSQVGTPKASGRASSKPTTPLAVRSSPRKAASVNGSIVGRGSSRASSPDKGSISIRRSGRRSGLANEIVTTDASEDEEEDEEEEEEEEDEREEEEDGEEEEEDEDDDEDEDDVPADEEIEDETTAKATITLDTTEVNSAETSGSEEEEEEEETSDRSEASGSSGDDEEETNASDDPDAEVDEEDDEDSNDEDDGEVDIPSAVSSIAVSEDGSASVDEEEDDEDEED